MNEEIEYAEMLEIPVSTVNVVRKTQRRRKQKNAETLENQSNIPPFQASQNEPLKNSVIAQVNERLTADVAAAPEQLAIDSELLAESANSEGRLEFDPIPERIDTVRLYSTDELGGFFDDELKPQDYSLDNENEGGRYAMKSKSKLAKGIRITLGVEFAAACVLCGAIFLTNVFMPGSAINTFFRSIHSANAATQSDTRTYSDFTLSPVVSELSDAALTLSPAGILSFTDACCVYPAANGKVADVTKTANGTYTVKVAHSSTFSGIISGLDYVYYAVGEDVKANVPIGYTDGEDEVQVTMYSNGALLNCFQLTEENCLAWVETDAE